MKSVLLLALAAVLLTVFVSQYPTVSVQPTPGVASRSSIPREIVERFREWKRQYNRRYANGDDEEFRLSVYYENVNYIEDLNAAQTEVEYGENQFMDLTREEWAATYLTLRVPEGRGAPNMDTDDVSDDVPNGAFSWVSQGAVGPVKNQGSCGSCWAFSATGVVEGYWFLNEGSLPNVSEQQLVDCSTSYGNQGCNGGWPASALQYVQDNGLVTGAEYPYTGRDGNCRINSGPYKVGSVSETSSCATLTADIQKQPTSVAVDATNWSFYRSGVFSTCGKNVNHGVLAVGWDDNNNWIIKNSWGTNWGQKGYITLKTGDTCAVCEYMANAYK